MDTAGCLLSEANIDLKYWPEVVKTAAYLKNCTLANTYELKTPHKIFMNKKPDVSNLRLYGSKVYVRVPDVKRESKFDRKADLRILVGYKNVGYRVLANNEVFVARHVEFVEGDVNSIGLKTDNESDEPNENTKSLMQKRPNPP